MESSSLNPYSLLSYTPRYFSLLSTRSSSQSGNTSQNSWSSSQNTSVSSSSVKPAPERPPRSPNGASNTPPSRRRLRRRLHPTSSCRAMSVAQRVSEEMDVALGSQVGYSIRFEDCHLLPPSSNT
ncbi:Pre-mRNA-splicing factor ATP-dependent RNA helicase DHX15 [Orchesella cincta]|uniref:Pre-mRNA-splicing factor ATP-dependent RNA helicase DHX15 n=1 Tax=Orchesella cincta TaxID=48709 RepID=A0A1D2MI52_ORCCI|nr:Pre-mRNA-splicing factor ATP-dependent RNA helicase DHX15 [Orchesella cincta]